MLCKKCGNEISENSKFCGYCGQLIERENSLNMDNEKNYDLKEDDLNLANSEEKSFNTGLVENSNDTKIEKDETDLNSNDIKLEFEPLQSSTPMEVEQPKNVKKNKSSTKVILVVLAIILIAVINILAFMSFGKNRSSKGSVSVLEKAVGNFSNKGNESGTVTAALQIESSTNDVVNLSASFLYQKYNDDYKLNIRLNKSALFDEMNIYSVLNKDSITNYINSKTLDMIVGNTELNSDTWLIYRQELDGFEDVFDEISKTSNSKQTVNLDKVIDSEHFKLIEKDNTLSHYLFIIDEKFFENAKNNLEIEDVESIDEAIETIKTSKLKKLEMDIYINEFNEISKISIDLAKYVDMDDINKAELSIEFKDFNSTKVEIPEEALNATMSIEDYLMQYDGTTETDLDTDLDTPLDYNF